MNKRLSEKDKAIQKKELERSVAGLLDRMKPQIALALPAHINVDRMCRIALTEFKNTPKLMECDTTSFLASVMICASLGLEIGTLGHAYLIPRKGQCTFLLGYQGMLELARRGGTLPVIEAKAVYDGDTFDVSLGSNPCIIHKPNKTGPRGKLLSVYARAVHKSGHEQFEWMTREEVEYIRDTSGNRDAGPWKKYFDEMAKKTVFRRLFKYLPCSVDMRKAVSYDESAEAGITTIDLAAEDYDIPSDVKALETGSDTKTEPASQVDKIAEQLA